MSRQAIIRRDALKCCTDARIIPDQVGDECPRETWDMREFGGRLTSDPIRAR
jgi:hypothetical protein